MLALRRANVGRDGDCGGRCRAAPWRLLVVAVWLMGSRGAVGQVVINEIMYDPAQAKGSESNAEFVELLNSGTTGVNLSGYTFREGDGTTWKTSAGFGSLTLPSGGFLLLSNAADEGAFRNMYADVPLGTPFEFFEMSLLNSPDGTNTQQVELLDDSATRVDWVLYDDAGDWVDVADGHSLELTVADATKNDSGSYWAESLVADGTPGRVNSVVPEPASLLLFAVGLGGVAGRRRWRNRRRRRPADAAREKL